MTFANQNDAFKILQIFLLIIHLLDLFIKLNTMFYTKEGEVIEKR